MKCLGVIPARALSSRLPGKVLKEIHGKTLVQRVWEQACKATTLSKVVIATDDEVVFDLAKSFGAEVLMTADHHATGSDRVSEAYTILQDRGEEFELVANVQGDMPFINPEVIDGAVKKLSEASEDFGMSTIARPITDLDEFLRTSAVKVAVGEDGGALYFSRAPIPYARDGFNDEDISEETPFGYKHMGLYVFRPQVLTRLSSLPIGMCEKQEKLEQLRALGSGIRIIVAVLPRDLVEPSIEVDTSEDLQRAIEWAKKIEISS